MQNIEAYINKSKVYQTIFEYPLSKIYSTKDKTFNRCNKPINPKEIELKAKGFLETEQKLYYKSKYHPYRRQAYYQCWKHPEGHSNDILLLHDINQHCGQFCEFIEVLMAAGFRIHIFDLPGHGRSDGIHGYIENMELMEESLSEVLSKIKSKPKVLGVGLGAFLALLYSVNHPDSFDKMSVVSPFTNQFALKFESANQLSVAKAVNKVIPRLPLIQNKIINHRVDQYRNLEFQADPLSYHKRMRARTAKAYLDAHDYLFLNAHKLTTPFLLQHGKIESLKFQIDTKQFLTSCIAVEDKRILMIEDDLGYSRKTYEQMCLNNSIDWLLL